VYSGTQATAESLAQSTLARMPQVKRMFMGCEPQLLPRARARGFASSLLLRSLRAAGMDQAVVGGKATPPGAETHKQEGFQEALQNGFDAADVPVLI
jgi:hypothetical protein